MEYKRNKQLEALVNRLMHDVYHPFTACVWLDEKGEIIDLYLFDTLYCKPNLSSRAQTRECILISNHFDGDMRPYDQDMCNWRMLSGAHPESVCYLMIYSEYRGLCAIEDAQQIGE